MSVSGSTRVVLILWNQPTQAPIDHCLPMTYMSYPSYSSYKSYTSAERTMLPCPVPSPWIPPRESPLYWDVF